MRDSFRISSFVKSPMTEGIELLIELSCSSRFVKEVSPAIALDTGPDRKLSFKINSVNFVNKYSDSGIVLFKLFDERSKDERDEKLLMLSGMNPLRLYPDSDIDTMLHSDFSQEHVTPCQLGVSQGELTPLNHSGPDVVIFCQSQSHPFVELYRLSSELYCDLDRDTVAEYFSYGIPSKLSYLPEYTNPMTDSH